MFFFRFFFLIGHYKILSKILCAIFSSPFWLCIPYTCMRAKSLQQCLTLCDPMGRQPTRFLRPWGFSRQEYWSELPCPPPGDLYDPGTEHVSPVAPALQVDSLPTEPPGTPHFIYSSLYMFISNSQFILPPFPFGNRKFAFHVDEQ